jgi:NAD(P)-dependent dehydrogenase (short-subunit alcohol dehydrogenase family)
MGGTLELGGLAALVTGGASGIGLAAAQALREHGARVAVLDQVEVEEPGLISVRADVSDDAAVRRAVAEAIDALAGLDILVNNVGIGAGHGRGEPRRGVAPRLRRERPEHRAGIARSARCAARLPERRDRQHLLDRRDRRPVRRALYGATKGAVLSLTLAMAADHLHEGIRVNCVNPGTTDTRWIGRLLDATDDPEAERAALVARQPHGRLVAPVEVAAAIAFLASPASGSTTGATLAIDGGLSGLRLLSRRGT